MLHSVASFSTPSSGYEGSARRCSNHDDLLLTYCHEIAAGLQPDLRRVSRRRSNRRGHAPLLESAPHAQSDRFSPTRNRSLAADSSLDLPAHPIEPCSCISLKGWYDLI